MGFKTIRNILNYLFTLSIKMSHIVLYFDLYLLIY